MPILTQAVGLGWYSVAPSALGLAEEAATRLDHRDFHCQERLWDEILGLGQDQD
jgi:hypothetical protein